MVVAMLLALAAPIPAQGAPTYLSCTLQEGATTQVVDLTVDEAGQGVTIDQKTTGRIVQQQAVFSPTEVKVLDEESTWFVDRVTLALRRVALIGDKSFTGTGSCKLAPAPAKRTF